MECIATPAPNKLEYSRE